MAVIVKSESGKAMRRLVESLREIDLIIVSYEAERAKCISIIERYGKDPKKRTYIKATEAAIAGDFIEDAIKDLDERKKRVLRALEKVIRLYTSDEDLSKSIVALLKAGGDPEEVPVGYRGRLDDALAWWKDFCKVSLVMAKQRMILEYRKENK